MDSKLIENPIHQALETAIMTALMHSQGSFTLSRLGKTASSYLVLDAAQVAADECGTDQLVALHLGQGIAQGILSPQNQCLQMEHLKDDIQS